MKPICVKCQLFFKPERNGIFFEEGMPVSEETNPHLDPMTATIWASYKLWSGDLWKCRGCGAEIIVGVGASRVAEHYEPDYAQKVQRFNSMLRVDDC